MITLEQALEFLDSLGVDNAPEFIVQALVDYANTINDCLEANYPPPVRLLILSYLIAIMGANGADKYISSQAAPSGASQSFRYKNDNSAGLYAMIRALDIKGCTHGILPPDPSIKKFAFVGVVRGGCHE